ncbi:MAG: HD domain-containing phosphohydrolase [Eubacteriales bacterium]
MAKAKQKKLRAQEETFDLAPVGYLIISDEGIINDANLAAATILGLSPEDLSDQPILNYIFEEDKGSYFQHRRELFEEAQAQACVIRMVKKDKNIIWVHIVANAVKNENGLQICHLAVTDITSIKETEGELLKEKALTDAIFSSAPGMIYLYDDQSRLVRFNSRHEEMTGYSSEELSKMSLLDWYKGDIKSQTAVLEGIKKALEEGFGEAEANLQRKDGSIIPMYFTASAFKLDGKQFFTGLGIDITNQKKREEEIIYLSYHDQLTGLYNRRFYEEELMRLDKERNLPLTIVMGDVNGLKLINDSFGHQKGDELLKKVADIIKKGCRADDIVARLGGDEFVIILPKTDELETSKVIDRIKYLALNEKVDSVGVSISFGFETKNSEEENIQRIFKDAEDDLYRKKLYESTSMRSQTIDLIMSTLYEKNNREMLHSKRVSEICKSIATKMNLHKEIVNQIKTAGLMHDIGKIGIDENILNKKEKLNNSEIKEINKHSEIGYRILSSVNEFSEIADHILEHQERWDGTGYPKGLKGEEISMQGRIIAIADAYDAMTSQRTYGKILSEDEAISEIKRCAGFQFDPGIAKIFIEKVLKKPW